ncbi:RIP metalloprotease RseP, partial [Aquimarina celericrescens]|nr:RIP metalloprotease RseP [Aquimarina celericrescens]
VKEFSKLPIEIINGNQLTIVRDGNTITKDIPVDFIAKLLDVEDKTSFIEPRFPFIIQEVPKESHNAGIDLQKGDEIIGINNQKV